MELVVEPLRKDMIQLQEKVDTLTNAIEKILLPAFGLALPGRFGLDVGLRGLVRP